MKALSIVGTLAMFLVGGGIVVHGIAPLHHAIDHFAQQQNGLIALTLPMLINLVLGFIIGSVVVGLVKLLPTFAVVRTNLCLAGLCKKGHRRLR